MEEDTELCKSKPRYEISRKNKKRIAELQRKETDMEEGMREREGNWRINSQHKKKKRYLEGLKGETDPRPIKQNTLL